jgi:hypothetical protein
MKDRETCQTVTVEEYATVKGLTINQTHYLIKSGKLSAIKTKPKGAVVIPKAALIGTNGFAALRPLELRETLNDIMVADFIGFSRTALRTFCQNNPDALVTFPLGRGFGVTTESLSRLLGHPLSLWPELPAAPAIAVPATPAVALAALPEIRTLVAGLRKGLEAVEVWLGSLSEPSAPEDSVQMTFTIEPDTPGYDPDKAHWDGRHLPGDVAWNLGRQSAEK